MINSVCIVFDILHVEQSGIFKNAFESKRFNRIFFWTNKNSAAFQKVSFGSRILLFLKAKVTITNTKAKLQVYTESNLGRKTKTTSFSSLGRSSLHKIPQQLKFEYHHSEDFE